MKIFTRQVATATILALFCTVVPFSLSTEGASERSSPTGISDALRAVEQMRDRLNQQTVRTNEITARMMDELVAVATILEIEIPEDPRSDTEAFHRNVVSHARRAMADADPVSDRDSENSELLAHLQRIENLDRERLVNQQIQSYLTRRLEDLEAAQPAEDSGSWQFRSLSIIRGEVQFSIHNPNKAVSFWATSGETRHGLQILQFDPESKSPMFAMKTKTSSCR